MRKNFVCTVVAILLCMPLQAQKLKKAFAQLKAGEYEEAEILFNRATRSKVEPAAAYFALGLIRLDPESGRLDYEKAYEMFRNSKEKFLKTPPKSAGAIKTAYGIKPSDADSMMRVAVEAEFKKIANNFSSDWKERFAKKYRTYKDLIDRLQYIGDSLDYRLACYFAEKHARFDLLCAITENPKTPFRDSAELAIPRIISKFHSSVFNTAMYWYMNKFRDKFTGYNLDSLVKRDKIHGVDSLLKTKYAYTLSPDDTMKIYVANKFVNDTSSSKYNESNLISVMEQLIPTEYSFYLLKTIVKPYINKKQYSKAVDIYLKYRSRFPEKQQQIDEIIGLLTEPDPPHLDNDRRLPDAINSPLYRSDYAPFITPDLTKIYFCQDMDMRAGRQEDMYVSEFRDGQWQVAQPVERFSSMEKHEAAEHIYPDESKMTLFLSGKIYNSDKQDDGTWGYPYRMDGKSDSKGNSINSGQWQSDTYFSPDGQVMLFASIRSTNIDGSNSAFDFDFHNSWLYPCDIYVSIKQPDGEWGAPVNLGPTINTPWQDRSPQLAADLKTLYFTSDGHYGLGGCDIFMSRRLSDTSWTQWSKPVNLGRIINTTGHEQWFNIGYDGKTVVYERNEVLYMGTMPEQFRAATTSLFKGVITDTNGKPLKASIIWEDIESSAHLGLLSSDPVTGEFTITLPLGRRYEYFVEADGFVPKSGIFDLANAKSSQTKRDSIALYSIEEAVDDDIAMGLTNILFEPSKADLKPESAGEIKHIAMFLKSNPHLNIEIAGHADASGSAASNQTLSQQRAETVKAEILKYGIPSFKIIAKGYGNSKPISSINGLNRRVEFRIIKN